MEEYKSRIEVPKKYQWDLTEYYESIDIWKKEVKKIEDEISNLEVYKEKINNANLLEEYLNLYFDIKSNLLNLYVYSDLNHDVELENTIYIETNNIIQNLYTKFNKTVSFFEPELLKIENDEFNNLFKKNKNLEKYKIYLQKIHQLKEHTLSEEKEKLICDLSSTYNSYQNIFSSLINSEHDYGNITNSEGKLVNITVSNFKNLKQDKDENIRKRAYKKLFRILEQYQTTESSLLNNFVKNNIILSKIYNYNSPWDKYLVINKLNNKIFESLQTACINNINVNHKFYKLMKKILNLKTLHTYDTSLIWNKNNKKYSIEYANNIVLNSLKVLGEEYYIKLKKIFDNNHIDYCQYKGKYSGGYCCSTYNKNSRILMNYKESFTDISTIAHESGHNVHHQFLNETTELCYRKQPAIIAEIASLTNEFLLANYMIKNSETNEEKLIGLENIIKVFQSNFFGAIMEGQLELKMYEHAMNNKSITANFLNSCAENLLKEYHGNIISHDKYSKLIWTTRSHYYMPFYLFSYAISVSVAAVLSEKIINNEPGILEKYYKFLKSGDNIDPVSMYQILDIDIEDIKVYESGIKYFDKQLDLYYDLVRR